MSGYLQTHHNAFIVSGGKVADIAHAYDEQPIVCFDLSRTMVDHCDHVYSMIEKFKDGCIFSGKYESRTKIFDVPHVIVFANFKPDLTGIMMQLAEQGSRLCLVIFRRTITRLLSRVAKSLI